MRVLHRGPRSCMMVTALVHLLDVAYRAFVLRRPLAMLPGLADLRDLWQTAALQPGSRAGRPRMGRFTFEEKIEYWSLLWGTVIMVATGFALWNPIATARFLPGQFIPAALAAHAGEALLAVLAVLVWHGYGVHLRHFNRSMFTGTLERGGDARAPSRASSRPSLDGPRPRAPAPARASAARAVLPARGRSSSSLLVVSGLYRFVTFEQTAIATVAPPPP